MTPLDRAVPPHRVRVRWWHGAVVLAALVVLGGTLAWNWAIGPPRPGTRKTVVVTIPVGASATRVGGILKANGVIRSTLAFRLLSGRRHLDSRLEPGPYRMSAAWPLKTVLGHLSRHDILAYRVTVPEGYTVAQAVARFVAAGIGTPSSFEAAVKQGLPGLHPPPGAGGDPLEGFLFPDTYTVPYGTPPRAVLRMMWRDFQQRTRQLRAELPPGESVWQWVTMASIVQAEDQKAKDAPVIAAVFWNRIKAGMPLQSDATVRYALGRKVHGGLSLADLTVNSPYNTYLHKGLPPGPIDCPGLVALEAALHPSRVPYLYFVATPAGGDLFATTYAQHEANVAKVEAMKAH